MQTTSPWARDFLERLDQEIADLEHQLKALRRARTKVRGRKPRRPNGHTTQQQRRPRRTRNREAVRYAPSVHSPESPEVH